MLYKDTLGVFQGLWLGFLDVSFLDWRLDLRDFNSDGGDRLFCDGRIHYSVHRRKFLRLDITHLHHGGVQGNEDTYTCDV